MYGFKDKDARLNDCGVYIGKDAEVVDLLEGYKHNYLQKMDIKLAKTPDGHYMLGIDASLGTKGFSFAPSLSGVYDSRDEAITRALKDLDKWIDGHPKQTLIEENIKKLRAGGIQLELF